MFQIFQTDVTKAFNFLYVIVTQIGQVVLVHVWHWHESPLWDKSIQYTFVVVDFSTSSNTLHRFPIQWNSTLHWAVKAKQFYVPFQ